MSKKILFIGGTGQISLPCVERAVAQGHDVSVYNRGERAATLPDGVTSITGDLTDNAAYSALAKHDFDVVCQFIAFTADQVARDVATFTGHTGQYIFISSASVYEKPAQHYVITETTPAINPYWKYSQDKIAGEEVLKASTGLKWTIVRPSHTVRSGLPTMMNEGFSIARRMVAGKPVLVAGDGTTPWTLTRSADFAVPFVGLLGKDAALGETFHITSDNAWTWNQIYDAIGRGLGVEAKIVNVPSATLARYHPDWEGPLMGDKTWAALFDNSKVKSVAGDFSCETSLDAVLAESLKHTRAHLAANPDETYALDPLMDRIAAEQSALGTNA